VIWTAGWAACAAALAAEGATAPVRQVQKDAQQLLDAGKVEEGLSALEAALKEQPGSMELGNTYRAAIRKNALEERAISFLKALAVEGAPDEAYFNAAFAYIDKIPRVGPMGAGFLSKRSIAMFRTVLDAKPDNWIANYGIGMNYLHWPDYFKKNESALGYLEKCLALQKADKPRPFHLLTYLRLGDAHARSGEIDKAIAVWQEGAKVYPKHPDLVARLETPRENITASINAYYNPNQSIGAIDTDVSVLWATEVPKSAVPLKRASTRLGSGGQLSTGAGLSENDIGLFSWFMKNLPFLSDREHYSKVDMSALGVKVDKNETRPVNEIAHGMIQGFLAVMNDESPEKIAARTREMDPYDRPFFHEGLGMGLAASLDTAAADSFKGLLRELEKYDTRYARLHLAGAGMWFGLESSRPTDTVVQAFEWLGPFGAAYAYEGFGFAQALFHLKRQPDRLEIGNTLPPIGAQSFYHGAGRAFWILGGEDVPALQGRLALVPAAFRKDATSGYGMGVSFTRVSSPTTVASYFRRPEFAALGLDDLATGVVMGYTIRDIADDNYMARVVAEGSGNGGCWLGDALKTGHQALDAIQGAGGDLHANWRAKIREQMAHGGFSVARMRCAA
jgi:tetratricopeptide (TPR) repeat protein